MASYKLFQHEIDLFRGAGGGTAYLVVATGATVNAYRQGATASAAIDLSSTSGNIAVYDTGGIRVNDTIQIGIDTGQTATVTAIADELLTVTATGAFDVSAVGTRLVVVTDKPYIYKGSDGSTTYSGTQGECPPISAATGNSVFFTTMQMIDLIVSGGGLVNDQLLIDQHGARQWNFVTLEDFGGIETLVTPTGFNNVTSLAAAVNYALKTGRRTVELGPGTYLTGTTQILDDVTTGLKFRGHGAHATALQMTAASGPVISLTGTTQDVVFEDLKLTRTSGASSIMLMEASVQRTVLRNVLLENAGNGISDQGIDTIIEDLQATGTTTRVLSSAGSGGRYRFISSKLAVSATAQITCSATDVEFTSPRLDWSTTALGGNCLLISAGGNIKVLGGTMTGGSGAVPDAAVEVTGGTGIRFIGTTVKDSDYGFIINGDDVMLSGCTVSNILQHGVVLQGTGFARVQSHTSLTVGLSGTNSYDHINVEGAASNKFINGVTCGQVTLNARYGVGIESGAGTNIRVIDVQGDPARTAGGMYFSAKAVGIVGVSASHIGPATAVVSPDHEGVGYLLRAHIADELILNVQDVGLVQYNSATAKVISNMTGGRRGQDVWVYNSGVGTVTFNDGGNFQLLAGSTVLATGHSAAFKLNALGTIWIEISIANS